jgi:hypothetical protein
MEVGHGPNWGCSAKGKKSKGPPEPKQHIMNIYIGSGDKAPLILDLGKCVVSFTFRPIFPHMKSPKHPLDTGLDGSLRSVHTVITKRKIPTLIRKSNMRCPLRSQSLH